MSSGKGHDGVKGARTKGLQGRLGNTKLTLK